MPSNQPANSDHDTSNPRAASTGLLALLSIACVLPACVVSVEDDGLLTVVNDSSFVIDELRVASIGSRFYGPDLVGGPNLFPGESLTVSLDCNYYDVLFVDEFGLECEVLDVDVCVTRTIFVIDDVLLDTCAFPLRAP